MGIYIYIYRYNNYLSYTDVLVVFIKLLMHLYMFNEFPIFVCN